MWFAVSDLHPALRPASPPASSSEGLQAALPWRLPQSRWGYWWTRDGIEIESCDRVRPRRRYRTLWGNRLAATNQTQEKNGASAATGRDRDGNAAIRAGRSTALSQPPRAASATDPAALILWKV